MSGPSLYARRMGSASNRNHGTDREQSAAEERAFYEAQRDAHARALKRHAERYLEEHCGPTGRRLYGALTRIEFAREAGLDLGELNEAVRVAMREVLGASPRPGTRFSAARKIQ